MDMTNQVSTHGDINTLNAAGNGNADVPLIGGSGGHQEGGDSSVATEGVSSAADRESFDASEGTPSVPQNNEPAEYPQDGDMNFAPQVFCYQTKTEVAREGEYFPPENEQQSMAEENCCCVECGVTFANIDLLLKHVQQHEADHYGSEDIYQGAGEELDATDDDGSPEVPEATDASNVLCVECGQVFENVDALVRHVETHESQSGQNPNVVKEEKHECPVCHQGFPNERLMLEHAKRHNSRGGIVSFSENVTDYSGGQPSTVGPKADFNVYSYKRRPTAKGGNALGNTTAHLCLTCGDVFRLLADLDKHYQMHKGTPQMLDHKCGLCGKVFSKMNNLHIHMRLHNQDRPYACGLCGKRFTQSSHLRQHELIHTQVRPFSCRFCPKTFRQSSHLHMHERIHTGMRPYKCCLCDKAFMQSSHLRIHERTHSRVRPYNCRFCNATFIQSAHMRLHEKRHLTDANGNSGAATTPMDPSNNGAANEPALPQPQS